MEQIEEEKNGEEGGGIPLYAEVDKSKVCGVGGREGRRGEGGEREGGRGEGGEREEGGREGEGKGLYAVVDKSKVCRGGREGGRGERERGRGRSVLHLVFVTGSVLFIDVS